MYQQQIIIREEQEIQNQQPIHIQNIGLTDQEYKILSEIYKQILGLIGYVLILFFLFLYYLILRSMIYDNCYFYHIVYKNTILTATILTVGLILGKYYLKNKNIQGFNLLFQFVCAVLISPGHTKDYFRAIPNSNSQFIYLPFSQWRLDKNSLGYCNKCKFPKPHRTHHCSICDKCVLKMDHHCPWIGNCVGYENHRHFALFLMWVATSTGYVSLLNIHMYFSGMFIYKLSDLYEFLIPLNATLTIVMSFFMMWNWYLILTGYTAIEFWDKNKTNKKFDMLDNIKIVFGDFINPFYIFLPSVFDLDSNGVIWDGQCLDSMEQEDEEEGINKQEQEDEEINLQEGQDEEINEYQRDEQILI